MATDKLPMDDLPGDLPENWKLNDAVTPSGTDAGLSGKHGYNYLMKAVNEAHKKINALIKALRDSLHAIAYSGSYKDLKDKPSSFVPSAHTHDDLYYTETEMTAKLNAKADNFAYENNKLQLVSGDKRIGSPVEIISASGGDTLPVGSLAPFSGTTLQDGWLWCNGQAINRTTYKDLFDIIGTTYGAGNGTTTFNLPNLANPLSYDKVGVEGIQFKSLDPELKYIIKAKQVVPIVASVVDNLDSDSSINALSALQGKNLNLKVSSLLSKIYTRDDYGIYTVPTNTDPLSLMYEGKFYTRDWLADSIPVASACCIIEVIHHTDMWHARTIIAHYPTYGYTFKNVMSNNVWAGWKLIDGEIPLCAGVYGLGVEFGIAYDVSLFSTLRVIITSQSNQTTTPCFMGSSYSTCTNSFIDGSNLCNTSVRLQKISSKRLIVESARRATFINGGVVSITNSDKVIAIYGRP